MFDKRMLISAAVFFCTTGWVYSGPVNGAEPAIGADAPAAEMVPPAAPAKADAPVTGEAPVAVPAGQNVTLGNFGRIDIHVKDLELSKVLQLLSIQAQRNIIATKNVSGTITADLYGVDFYDALDAILHANGFGYIEKGNFLYVYTAQEIAALKQAERKTTQKVVRLNYLNAADASTFVTPLLSSAGAISLSGPVGDGFQPSISDAGANKSAHADTLVVRDYAENIEQILDVIKELDIRPKQVMVEVTVLEAKLDEANGFGVDISVVSDFGFGSFNNPLSLITNLLQGPAIGDRANGTAVQSVTTSADLQQRASFKMGVATDDVTAFVHALDQVTDTTVLANPKLLVLNRQKADLLVGKRLAYLSSTLTETFTTQTVEYLDTGTQLSLRPFISNDDMVRLELRPSISTGTLRAIGNTTVPDATTEEIITNIILRSGQTAVLGGLFTETTSIGRKQVPGFGDIPLLGAAFKGVDDATLRSEVIFLVTPTVMKDEALYAGGERAKENVDTARYGAKQGLLPWSREKMASGHLREAVEHMNRQEMDKALACANKALSIDPTMIEARRLKDQIKNQTPYWPMHSGLEDAVDVMIQQNRVPAAAPATQPAAMSLDVPAAQPAMQSADAAVSLE